jgi:hypothetical protein
MPVWSYTGTYRFATMNGTQSGEGMLGVRERTTHANARTCTNTPTNAEKMFFISRIPNLFLLLSECTADTVAWIAEDHAQLANLQMSREGNNRAVNGFPEERTGAARSGLENHLFLVATSFTSPHHPSPPQRSSGAVNLSESAFLRILSLKVLSYCTVKSDAPLGKGGSEGRAREMLQKKTTHTKIEKNSSGDSLT